MSRASEHSLSRDPQASTSHYGFSSPMQLDPNPSLSASGQNVPPFENTKLFGQFRDRAGNHVQPEIHAKIDKGFFKADQDWTCYRRNYFSVACSYHLKTEGGSDVEPENLLLSCHSLSHEPVEAFSMCIAAKADGEDGKSIELVKHTPKRDKGPMSSPDKKELRPNPSGNLGIFPTGTAFGAAVATHGYDPTGPGGLGGLGGDAQQNVASFDRIQFKKATANNGKRRAAQQYFHIVVELFARVTNKVKGSSSNPEPEWIKIAHRVSDKMVVRGRSPGHYQDERRNSNASMGPGGAGGHVGDFARDMGGGGSMGGPHLGIPGSSFLSRPGTHGYHQGHHHNAAFGHAASDTHSIGSSASSSMRSSLGPFSDNNGPGMGMEDAPHAAGYSGYCSGYDSRPAGVTAPPRPMHVALDRHTSSSEASGPVLDPPFNYLHMPPLKEEPHSRATPIKTEPATRRLEPNYSFQLPTFYDNNHSPGHGGWHGLDHPMPPAAQPPPAPPPPRDCRSLLLETGKTYFPATQAM